MHAPLSEERLRKIEEAEAREEQRIASLRANFSDNDFVVLAIIRGWNVSIAREMKLKMESAPIDSGATKRTRKNSSNLSR
jgi:hypothetical protein